MGKRRLFKCDWTDPNTGDVCGEITRGVTRRDYHQNNHRRMSPKVAQMPTPTRRKVYHVPAGDSPRPTEKGTLL